MRIFFCLICCVIALAGLACSADAADQIEAVTGKGDRIEQENALVSRVNAAAADRNWHDAETLSNQLITMNPDRWEYRRSLADTELFLGKYKESVDDYDKALGLIRKSNGKDFSTATASLRNAVSEMFVRKGNANLKMGKSSEAIASYARAAELSDKPGRAYFNLCAIQYNTGNMEGAIKACDKAIQFDPDRADAYFIKGSCMFGSGNLDKSGKYLVPPGTVEALGNYLRLAPDGGHAADVKQMLEMLGTR